MKQGIVRLEVGTTKNSEARAIYMDNEVGEISNQQREVRKKNNKLLPYVVLNSKGLTVLNGLTRHAGLLARMPKSV